MESIIHDRQPEYYDAINESNNAGESTAFIEFMLSDIKDALLEAVDTAEVTETMTADEVRWYRIEQFIDKTER